MHNDAWLETRQDFQEEIIDVSANFHRMRTVDKDNIALFEFREELQIRYLPNLFFDQRVASQEILVIETLEETVRCRLDQSRLFSRPPGQKHRRQPADNFDDQPRLKLANHAVSHEGFRASEEPVIKTRTAPSPVGWIGIRSYWPGILENALSGDRVVRNR